MKENPALTRIDPVFGFNPKIVFKMLFHVGPKNEAEGVYGKYMVYLGRKEPSTEGEASLLGWGEEAITGVGYALMGGFAAYGW